MKNIKISIILNILIVLFTIFACIAMFAGIKFMSGKDLVLNDSSIEMFKYFTVDSNILMGLSSLLFLIYEIMYLNSYIKSIPKGLYLFKLITTVGVSLTFFVVFTYLGPIADGGIKIMLMNSNLFFHFIIPILSIIVFIFFEKTDKLTFKDTFVGTLIMIIYSFFYIINVLIHTSNGVVSVNYDWYLFVQNGVWTAVIVVPIIFIITYLISLLLYRINRIKN